MHRDSGHKRLVTINITSKKINILYVYLSTHSVANSSVANSFEKNLSQSWEQSSYHNAISCEDERTFRYLFKSPNVDQCSETALRRAMCCKKNVFLAAMLPLLSVEKFRQTFVLLEKSGPTQQSIELSARSPQRSSSTSQEMVPTSPRKRPHDQQDDNDDDDADQDDDVSTDSECRCF